ncbi:glucose-1-phosphate adenylyltransferase [Desulfomonile tiedjei DSM 6799]|uniref:Glucose-1-phosphate adenylyltransferase n=2 Tax=Desulfomonile tiedjei TaxID=2358 RepID=I4C468_DESTA|nr:glucose-1-phosphate adenylyltransferase [Desulfomonile tiedjei DSM 6799]
MNLRSEMKKTLCILMAGGKGERLYPLTKARAKPSVRFGGIYRIVDFTLSNCLNSDIRRVYVLTQYRSVSLDRHIRLGWNIFNHELGEFIECIPPQQRNVDRWYRGTADSIYQNIHILQRERPERVLILSGDHVYKMNYNDMLAFHIEKNAQLTVAGVEVDRSEASAFGVIGSDDRFRIVDWEEKPKNPKPVPGNPDKAFVSMGVYIFNTDMLVKSVIADAKNSASSHDFGKDVVPSAITKSGVFVHSFKEANNEEGRYWRDIGTLDAYWQANMDLCKKDPPVNLYDPEWPIRTYQEQVPPAKTVSTDDSEGVLNGAALNSIISGGCIVSGATVRRSVLSLNVSVGPKSLVEDSVILENVKIGSRVKIKKAIIDQDVHVPDDFVIGHDPEADKARFTISNAGVVIVPRGMSL